MPRTLRTTEPGEGVELIRRAGGERRSRPYRACQAGAIGQGYGCVTKPGGIGASICPLVWGRRQAQLLALMRRPVRLVSIRLSHPGRPQLSVMQARTRSASTSISA